MDELERRIEAIAVAERNLGRIDGYGHRDPDTRIAREILTGVRNSLTPYARGDGDFTLETAKETALQRTYGKRPRGNGKKALVQVLVALESIEGYLHGERELINLLRRIVLGN